MLSEIHVRADVPEFRSMLTNFSVWLQVMMRRTFKTAELSWRHSQLSPRRDTYAIQEDTIDLVVDHIRSVLLTGTTIRSR